MKKVLIADHNATLRRIVRATLEGEDCEVLEATGGAQAISVAREQQPDLILLNDLMPDIDGIEACRTLKSDPATSHITILMLMAPAGVTAVQPQGREQAAAAGADHCLVIPFSPLALLKLAEAVPAR